jgi:hypothetical protein
MNNEVKEMYDQDNVPDLHIAHRLIHISESAAKRNLEFSLSFAKLKKLLKTKTCFFTGKKITYEQGPDQLTIDRIDNSKGYIDTNVVACCKSFNSKKGSLNIDEIVQLYEGLIKHGDIKK